MDRQRLKKLGASALVALVAVASGAVSSRTCAPTPQAARGFSSIGQTSLTGGGGLSKVHTTGDQLTGSGTSGNPLALSLSVSSPVSGTGSSGSPITSSGDIAGVTAGSGLINGGTSGTVTLDVAAGSGITVAADSVSTNAGSGLTYSSGALITNAGSGLTYSSGALITNSGSGLTYSSGALVTNAGSGLTYSSGALVTNAGSGLTYSSGALITNAGSGLTYSSGALITNAGTGLSYSAGALTLNMTAATCANGQAVTAITATGGTTCGNAAPNNIYGQHREYNDEWVDRTSCANQVRCGTIWQGAISGTSASMNEVGASGRFGVLQGTTGSTSTGRTGVVIAFTAIDYNTMTDATYEWVGTFPTLSTSGEEYASPIGFVDAVTVDQADGCYFLYDRGNVATSGPNTGNADKWSCWCVQNSTRTTFLMDGSTVSDSSFTTVSAALVAGTYQHLKVVVTGTSEADFYVNGTKSCVITHNIPSGSTRQTGAGFQQIKSNGGTGRTMNTDLTSLVLNLSSAPSP